MAIHKISKLVTIAVLGLGLSACALAGEVHASAYLGVMVDNVSPEKAAALHLKPGTGAAIAGVDQDGPAYRAGIKNGDIVIAFDGKPVEGAEQLKNLIHSSTPGYNASVTILRDGQKQDVKVTLGDWSQMADMPRSPVPPRGSVGIMGPMAAMPPLPRMYPDMDLPSFTQLSSRHGVVVEPLSPQLCDYFGVPQNKGVLVRSVEKGSLGAAAGIKAGDVIVRINGETIHDMADWRRALKTRNGKVKLAIVRDKKEQTIEINFPANSSELKGGDWDAFEQDTQAMAEQMEKLGPEFAKSAQEMTTLAQLGPQEMDEIRRQAETASKTASAEMRKQADIAVKTLTPEMKKQTEEMRKQAKELHKQTEQMRQEAEKMVPEMEKNAKDISDAMKPTAEQLAAMSREIAQAMKDMQPQLKLDMEELKKELEQEKQEWQEMFKGMDSRQHF